MENDFINKLSISLKKLYVQQGIFYIKVLIKVIDKCWVISGQIFPSYFIQEVAERLIMKSINYKDILIFENVYRDDKSLYLQIEDKVSIKVIFFLQLVIQIKQTNTTMNIYDTVPFLGMVEFYANTNYQYTVEMASFCNVYIMLQSIMK